MYTLRLRLLISFVAVCVYAAGDTLPSAETLQKKAADSPKVVLPVLDSLDRRGAYPSYRTDFLRACAYHSMSKYYMAIRYAQGVLDSKEAQADTLTIKRAYMLIAQSAVASYRLNEAIRCIAQGEYYAHLVGDRVLEASMLQMEGEVYRKLGMLEKGYHCLRRGIFLLSDGTEEPELYHLSHLMGYLMAYYIEDKRLEEAWTTGLRRAVVIGRMEDEKVSDAMVDNQKGYFYSKMAYLAYRMGNYAQAGDYYHRFAETRMASTVTGKLEINDYLLAKGDFKTVLSHNEAYMEDVPPEDTLNIVYIRTLYQSSKAYQGVADHKRSYETLLRVWGLHKSARLNKERNELFDLADLDKAMRREYELKQAAADLEVRNRMLVGMGVVTLLLTAMLVTIVFQRKVVSRKDRKMTSLIVELNDRNNAAVPVAVPDPLPEPVAVAPEEEQPSDTLPGPPSDGEEDSQPTYADIFRVFDSRVKEERMYLNYQLSRDDYARFMGVDRNRFAAILKECAQGNLNTYLNNLRLDYSVGLFRAHPDWSINEIASKSALPSLSTFYRLFKDKYGMSPNVFRTRLGERGG